MANSLIAEVATYSALDSERFGIRVARARISSETLPLVLQYCGTERIELLIARCATWDLDTVQKAEAEGFFLTDTLVYYQFDLSRKQVPQKASDVPVRLLRPEDADRLGQIGAAAFK